MKIDLDNALRVTQISLSVHEVEQILTILILKYHEPFYQRRIKSTLSNASGFNLFKNAANLDPISQY